jgi:CDP-paratose 2-epimerase
VNTAPLQRRARPSRARGPALITGGAGFIGSNLAHRLLSEGTPVIVFDNLSRPGVERNLAWLRARHGNLVEADISDVRDGRAVFAAARRASRVFHLAAQVAVTTSLVDPGLDFDVNARGTLNLLDALRALDDAERPLVFTSTNKVYGDLPGLRLAAKGQRYSPVDRGARAGISEAQPLAFHTPYGCSKGAADQYVLDFARTGGVPAVVFRMSCIYGPRQYGTEDQGWVAHFLLQAFQGRPLTIYGDGKQVRDVLFVEDLVSAMLLAQERMGDIAGRAFNIGGGPGNAISLLELTDLIAEITGRRPALSFEPWRPADQRFYVSNIQGFSEATGWKPMTGVRAGLRRLAQWIAEDALAGAPARNGNGNGRGIHPSLGTLGAQAVVPA